VRSLLTVALIPARAGSKRLVGKNLRILAGHPLIAYTIAAARAAAIQPYVSTEDQATAEVAMHYGAEVVWRPEAYARDDSPDIEWVRHALEIVPCDVFCLLRPTNPFRTAATILRALERFFDVQPDSLRAVERVTSPHPYKMWRISEDGRSPTQWMTPLVGHDPTLVVPYHSRPTQTLPEVYMQNASLEIAWRATVEEQGSISGTRIIPFYTRHPEGVDVNDLEDWEFAERLAPRYLHMETREKVT